MDSFEHTHNLKLPLLVPNQSGKEFTHNEALIIIDNIVHNAVIDIIDNPPADIKTGSKYIVGLKATEAFKNKENQVAIYDDNGWRFVKVQDGYFVWIINKSNLYIFEKNNWKVLDTKDNRIQINEPKKDEIIKFDGTNFINSSSLLNLEQLSVIGNLTIKDINKTDKFKIEVNNNNSNINILNTENDWIDCMSISNINGIVNIGTDITIKGNPITTGENLLELKENYEITEVAMLEFTDLDLSFQHKFLISDLKSNMSSAAQMFCNVGYNDTYIESSYYWESFMTNSNEAYSYIKNKNGSNSYQITSDRNIDAGIKIGASANVEFCINPTISSENFMSCLVQTSTEYPSLKYYNVISSCLVYSKNKINKIKFFLSSGNFKSGKVKHYIIK